MNPARPDAWAFGQTVARLMLARKGLHPDLLRRPEKESDYLLELNAPDPVRLYNDPDQ